MHAAILSVLTKSGFAYLILCPRCTVEIQDRPNTLPCTKFDDTIKMLEAFLFEYAGIHVVLKVMVVERQSDTIETQ